MCKITYDEVKSNYHDQATKVNQVVSDYQKEYQEYLLALAKYKESTGDKSAVDGSEIVQNLYIGDESLSEVNFTPSNNVNVTYTEKVPVVAGEIHYDWQNWADKGYTLVYGFSGDTTGNLGTATWTNLTNSYYVDNQNEKHKISKITIQFSNEKLYENKPGFSEAYNGADVGLAIYSGFSYGLWYLNSDSIDVDFTFYDENGKPIDFSKNEAYLGFGSLNHWNSSTQGFGENHSSDYKHVEHVKILEGGIGVNLAGSTVTNHFGDEFSDNENSNKNDWGLFKISGNHVKFTWYTEHKNDINTSQLYTIATAIPTYSGLKQPSKPTVSYKYSTVIVYLD